MRRISTSSGEREKIFNESHDFGVCSLCNTGRLRTRNLETREYTRGCNISRHFDVASKAVVSLSPRYPTKNLTEI